MVSLKIQFLESFITIYIGLFCLVLNFVAVEIVLAFKKFD